MKILLRGGGARTPARRNKKVYSSFSYTFFFTPGRIMVISATLTPAMASATESGSSIGGERKCT